MAMARARARASGGTEEHADDGLGIGSGLWLGLGLGLGRVEGPRNMPISTVEVAGSIRPNLSSDELTVPLYVKAVRRVG